MASALPEIEGFEIRRLIGRGGSASVYESFDPRHGRSVAIKVIDVRRFDPASRRAFTRELRAMGRLADHPNVVDVFDSGFSQDGSAYLVMPLIEDGTIDDLLQAEGAMASTNAISLGITIAAALETAHRRGILHCDIKPSNLFVGPFDKPLVGDFGIASVAYAGVTTTTNFGVTVRYAAPEVLDDEPITVRSDIYSLGATLFALIEGQPPYSGENPTAVIKEIFLNKKFPRLTVDAPAGLADLLQEMSAIDPDYRPESMAVVVERLQAIQKSEGLPLTVGVIGDIGIDGPDAREPLTEVVPVAAPASMADLDLTRIEGEEEVERKSKAPWLAGAMLVALAAVAGGVLYWPNNDAVLSASEAADATSTDEQISVDLESNVPSETSSSVDATTATTRAVTAATTLTTEVDEITVGLSNSGLSEANGAVLSSSQLEATLDTLVPIASTTSPVTVAPTTTVQQIGQITGVATNVEGTPVPGVSVSLYQANGDPTSDPVGKRSDFVSSQSVNNSGRFTFTVPVGCYIVALQAPDYWNWDDGALIIDVGACIDSAGQSITSNHELVPIAAADATLNGSVSRSGTGVSGVTVDVFLSNAAGERGSFADSTTTDNNGSFSIEVPSACYKLTFAAPDGSTFTNGEPFVNSDTMCLDAGSSATADANLN